jgi:hypothetical protein
VKTAEQILRDYELEHRVPKKLQTLIIEVIPLRFVREARVRERFSQQKRVAKLIPDTFLERRHIADSEQNRIISSTE